MSVTAAPPAAARPGLAVVRCGDRSLHASWAVGTSLFDVAVSYFGSDDARTFPEARFVHRYKGGKWDGIAAFFDQHPEVLSRYEYLWFPDDDLALDGAAADRLLEIGLTYNLDLWQPGLDRQSYFSHIITLAVDGLQLRYTNFIEIMAPVLRRQLLEASLPLFRETKSGFGLDYLWPQRAEDFSRGGEYRCAVIDCVTMTHTRPIGSALRKTITASGGLTTREEYAQILAGVRSRNPWFRSMGLPVPRKRVHAGQDMHGGRLERWAVLRATLRHFRGVDAGRTQPVGRLDLLFYAATAFL